MEDKEEEQMDEIPEEGSIPKSLSNFSFHPNKEKIEINSESNIKPKTVEENIDNATSKISESSKVHKIFVRKKWFEKDTHIISTTKKDIEKLYNNKSLNNETIKVENPSKEEINTVKKLTLLDGIRSKFILNKVIKYLSREKLLKLIKYNKQIQKKLNIDLEDYKSFNQTEIELKFDQNISYYSKIGIRFVNYTGNKSNYHIYFNDNKEEAKSNYMEEYENISKVRIVIDRYIKSFKKLFYSSLAREINFIKFSRKDIIKMNSMFKKCHNLTKINISKLNTENVTDMGNMFSECSKLGELDVSNFNTSNVKNMNKMFEKCELLKQLDLGNFDTSKVNDMSFMFENCISLEKIKLENFNTSNVENMHKMFEKCESLKQLDLGNFDTSEVKDMSSMFEHCISLEKIKLENFNTVKLENMSKMFKSCLILIDLDISKFKLKRLFLADFVFSQCSKRLKKKIRNQIYLKDEAYYDG